MLPFATYEIVMIGTAFEVNKAVNCIADVIGDQGEAIPNLLDRHYSDNDDDYDDDAPSATFEETLEIWQTRDCVWIEDIEQLAAEIAINAPGLQFFISGHVEDPSDDAGDEMDFKITYKDKKLFSQSTDWYQHIHMDDFETYSAFAAHFCDQHSNPRYTEEDYEGFKDCANEWYVLDGGHGEFSTNAPLRDPVRLKLKFLKT